MFQIDTLSGKMRVSSKMSGFLFDVTLTNNNKIPISWLHDQFKKNPTKRRMS